MTGLPKSTFHDMLRRTTLPRYELYHYFLSARGAADSGQRRAVGARPDIDQEWRAAYARAEADQERRRLELLAKKTAKPQPPEALEANLPAPAADVHNPRGRIPRKLFARWIRRAKADVGTEQRS